MITPHAVKPCKRFATTWKLGELVSRTRYRMKLRPRSATISRGTFWLPFSTCARRASCHHVSVPPAIGLPPLPSMMPSPTIATSVASAMCSNGRQALPFWLIVPQARVPSSNSAGSGIAASTAPLSIHKVVRAGISSGPLSYCPALSRTTCPAHRVSAPCRSAARLPAFGDTVAHALDGRRGSTTVRRSCAAAGAAKAKEAKKSHRRRMG